jgi:hypothetical protein
VDARRAVQTFLPLLSEAGLFYFSLVFDGATLFEPVFDPVLDARIEWAYHQTMDWRVVAGLGYSGPDAYSCPLAPEGGSGAGSSD